MKLTVILLSTFTIPVFLLINFVQSIKADNCTNGLLSLQSVKSYEETKDSIIKTRKAIAAKFLSATNETQKKEALQQARNHFINSLTQSLYPLWEGTSWSFYGNTQTPKNGKIACGYFVTTLLEHTGVKLDRIGLAEIESETMIRKLVVKENIIVYRNTGIEKFIQQIKNQGDGLYLVGLDFHTGFIWCRNQQVYFIHSSYIGPECVVKETAGQSPILISSRYRVTGKISDDKIFLTKWLLEKPF